MINLSTLCCGTITEGHELRYARRTFADGVPRPVVVWNATARCNLRCLHCYAAGPDAADRRELSTDEARAMIDDLSAFDAPVLVLSGGEPVLREDLAGLVAHARNAGIRPVLSTNGTLLTGQMVDSLIRAGLSYAGVSLDGLREVNDAFRGAAGAFEAALAGLRRCLRAGLKAGLRFTVTSDNIAQVPGILDLVEREGIPRVCFYHLVPTGNAASLVARMPSALQTRSLLDLLIERTAAWHAAGMGIEVLTVDNHADGPYVCMALARTDQPRAEQAKAMLARQGGNAGGERIACVSWDGDVYPDQFWRSCVLGNVRSRPFSEIWSAGDPAGRLARLRDRRQLLGGRCARCRWLNVCNGNLRARAEAMTGDPWAEDPACYLTDEEIAP